VQQARASAAAEWIRRTRPAAAVWHGAGFWLRFWRRILPQARKVSGLARKHEVQLIHCNDALSISRIGVFGSRLSRIPCVCHIRRFDRLGWFEREMARSVGYFIFNSQAIQSEFLRQSRRATPYRVIYNGVDLADFPLAVDPVPVRMELGLRPDAPVIGILGRLVEWKGHDVFLRAMARVWEEQPDVQGLVVGSPEVSNHHIVEQLQALAASLGLSEAVHFAGHRTDVARMLAAMDILAHTSVAPEPFGRVLIEGMAMAKPVVASGAGGVPEIVLDGETGLLVRPGDDQELARALLCLLHDPGRAEALGQAGRQRVETHFTADHHLRQVQEVYGEVLGDR
jgi:glycosyltransferase involved in cell wall biosynthesis